MTKKFKEIFTVYKDSEGNYHREEKSESGQTYLPVKLAVVRPSHKDQQKAQEVYTRRWRELAENGCPLRAELNDLLRKRELWNDDMQSKEDGLLKKIQDNLDKIKGRVRLSEAQKLMKENIKLKAELILLRFNRNQLDQNTAESLSEQERFNFLVSACTVYDEDKKPFFSSYENFITEDEAGNPVTTMGGEAMWRLTTNLDEDYRKDWPEYQFLKKYKLVDEKFRFLKGNKLVDIDDKAVDEDGDYINEKGEKINAVGRPLNEPEFGEILDDNDNVILDEKDGKKEDLVLV